MATRPPPAPRLPILGLGLVSLDLALQVPDLPPDGRRHATRAVQVGGGMGANTLAALTALGWPSRLLAVVGEDDAGWLAVRSLRQAGLDTTGILRRPGAVTAQAVCVAQSLSPGRTIIGLPEHACELRVADLPAAWRARARAAPPAVAAVHTDGWHAVASLAALRRARAGGICTSVNLGWPSARARDLCRLAELVVVSEEFMRQLGVRGAGPALVAGLARWVGPDAPATGARRWLVVTVGERGAWALAGDAARPIRQPAFRVPVVDSTGAGDSFHAGLLHGRLLGWPMDRALRCAAACGALACTALGAGGAGVTAAGVARLLRRGTLHR